jgi:hypothetical protein
VLQKKFKNKIKFQDHALTDAAAVLAIKVTHFYGFMTSIID